MPTYEYQCSACAHQVEAFQKMSDDALTECPKCGKSTLQKQISAVGFQLKGTGWYATDFRNKDKPGTAPSSSADTGNKPPSDNKPTTGSES